jgi:hypothetical protein
LRLARLRLHPFKRLHNKAPFSRHVHSYDVLPPPSFNLSTFFPRRD